MAMAQDDQLHTTIRSSAGEYRGMIDVSPRGSFNQVVGIDIYGCNGSIRVVTQNGHGIGYVILAMVTI